MYTTTFLYVLFQTFCVFLYIVCIFPIITIKNVDIRNKLQTFKRMRGTIKRALLHKTWQETKLKF
jgi:hypothetical protein